MALALIFDSVGVGEWFTLLAVVLIVIGPKRLPETARKFGNYYSKFRRAAESFKRQLMEMDTEINRAIDDASKEIADSTGIPLEADTSDNPYYGPGYDEGYGYDAYGRAGYDGEDDMASQDQVAATSPSPAEEPKKAQVDRSAVKIMVNAAPEAAGEKKNGAQTA